jgi:hypothetical protein
MGGSGRGSRSRTKTSYYKPLGKCKNGEKNFSGKKKKVAGFSPYLVKVSEDTV